MRKLRKHPETKDVHGVEFVSGGDSFNVAQSLALPQFIINKLKQSPISYLYANTDILNTHTSKIDKAFAYCDSMHLAFSISHNEGNDGRYDSIMDLLGVK